MTGHEDNMRNAAVFAESVRREMRDLPAEQVADLTDGLEADMVASLADGGSLPDAVVYAHDLMRAAGIEVSASGRTGTGGRMIAAVLRAWSWLRHSVRGLAPAWWVFRAWVLMQVIGWLVGFGGSSYWFAGQWGGRELVAVVAFLVLVSFSVRIGRDKWLVKGRTETLVSVLLAVSSIFVLVSRPSYGNGWFVYGTPGISTVPTWDCSTTPPELIGTPVSAAVEILVREGFAYEVVDMTGFNMTNSAGIGDFRVLKHDPHFTEMSCGARVTLMIDPSGAGVQASRPGQAADRTTTTVPPAPTTVPRSATTAVKATTTVPRSATTAVKATTTTAP